MNTFTLKLILTPLLIGSVSLAGRRWGPAISGWLVGLPLTSGPISFFLALNQGVTFASAAAVGTLAGTISQAVFCLAYGRLASRFGWPIATLASCLFFAAATIALQYLVLPLIPLFVVVAVALAAAIRLMPGRSEVTSPTVSAPPRWDIPARMIVATAFVVFLTGLAPKLGPRLTGLLSPFPLYAATLAVFAHHQQGPTQAANVLRGLLLGLFAFAGFFLVLGGLLGQTGILLAFAAAMITAFVFQAGSLWLLRRRPG